MGPWKADGNGAAAVDLEPPELSAAEFEKFSRFLAARCGLHIPSGKLPLLRNRIGRRLRTLRCPSFQSYFDLVSGPAAGDELDHLYSVVTTHETHFFREPHHFEMLRRHVVPGIVERGLPLTTLRLWSAGCSTGQEAWTLAAVASEALAGAAGGQDGPWSLRVLGTDIDATALRVAKGGVYPGALAREIPARHLGRDFELGPAGLEVAPRLRRRVRFEQLNLAGAGPWRRVFDVIFCRNTLMYLHGEARESIVRLFERCLLRGGYLFLGTAESLRGMPELLATERIGKYQVYRKTGEGL